MKRLLLSLCILAFAAYGCSSQRTLAISSEEKAVFDQTEADSVRIANEATQYEIIIIEPGFYSWLNTYAKPEGYYSQSYMENRNAIYVMNWNQRVIGGQRYDPFLYELQINYDPQVDYGYEVNYKLFNYFIYFQRKFNQRLGPWVPRI